MSVRQNKPGRRPNDGHGPFGWTTVRQDFLENFAGKSFLFKSLVPTVWHIVRTVARLLQVISL
jgi:hypothetical protein